jgi:flagellin-like hook-associated protein FlgL
MVAPVTTNSANSVSNNPISPLLYQAPVVPTNTATLSSTTAIPTGPAQPKPAVSAETQRYTAVQQSLSNAKSAISSADTANKQIDDSLKQVRDIATKLSNDNLASKDREKLQADYQKLREGIVKSQEQASVKTGDQKPGDPKSSVQKTNLLTDDKALTTATNTRGGQLDIQSSKSAKALGLPEKLGSAADAKALLQGNESQAGSLANAEKSTRDTAARLKKVEANVDQKLETSTAVAKAVKRLDAAKNGGVEVSAEREQQRSQALEKARETSQLLKSQLGGLSPNNNSGASNPLLALLR